MTTTTSRTEKRSNYYLEYGQRLRVTRLALGITEADAAVAHGFTVRTYRRWEAGQPHRGGHRAIKAFADKYNIALEWLICGEASGLGDNLTGQHGGKLAILPVMSAERRTVH